MKYRAQYLYSVLQDYPAQTQESLARLVKWRPNAISHCLPAMEYFGYLLWEDDNERLYPFRIAENLYNRSMR